MGIICVVCKNTFTVPTWRLKRNVKYCSSKCRIEGLAIKSRRPVWSKCQVCNKNIRSVPSNARQFCSKKCSGIIHSLKMTGRPSRNKGIKTGIAPRTAFKMNDPRLLGDNNHAWMGDKVGYHALHSYISKKLGKPNKCLHCKREDNKIRYEWANISGKYKRDFADWIRLCANCHKAYDAKGTFHISNSI